MTDFIDHAEAAGKVEHVPEPLTLYRPFPAGNYRVQVCKYEPPLADGLGEWDVTIWRLRGTVVDVYEIPGFVASHPYWAIPRELTENPVQDGHVSWYMQAHQVQAIVDWLCDNATTETVSEE